MGLHRTLNPAYKKRRDDVSSRIMSIDSDIIEVSFEATLQGYRSVVRRKPLPFSGDDDEDVYESASELEVLRFLERIAQ